MKREDAKATNLSIMYVFFICRFFAIAKNMGFIAKSSLDFIQHIINIHISTL